MKKTQEKTESSISLNVQRWLDYKVREVLKYPQLLPYSLDSIFGRLEITKEKKVFFNGERVIY